MASRRRVFKKASIILTNYNSEEYIYQALDSIIRQDYKNIELIITDDCSKKFDKKEIVQYINQKSKKIQNVNFLINKKNIGTVKTLNKAIKMTTGDYILFFAADDKLANNKVISNFIKYFDETNYNIITSQWVICDEKMNKIKEFVDSKKMNKINKKKNNKELLLQMCCSNIFGSGSTCYRKEIFKKYGNIDEKYKYLEDWPFWIKLISKGEKIYYADFDGLLHRGGGISETHVITETKKEFFKEIIDTFENEIIPIYYNMSFKNKKKILRSYYYHILMHENYIDCSHVKIVFNNLLLENKLIYIYWIFHLLNPNILTKIKILFKFNKIVPITFIITFFIGLLIANIIQLSKSIYLAALLLLNFIIYFGLNVLLNFKKLLKKEEVL